MNPEIWIQESWELIRKDIKAYVKGCDICLGSKTIKHKLYRDLQSLLILTHWWKDRLMDFVTGFQILTDCKEESYYSILVIINWLTKMLHYKLVKVTINAPGLAEVILVGIVWYHGLPNLIISDRGSLLTLKFWSLLCYFLSIKRRLLTAFYPQTNSQTKQ